MSIEVTLNVTSCAKMYTNGFVLNGQKPTANQRVANGFSNGFNGFLNASMGKGKIPTLFSTPPTL